MDLDRLDPVDGRSFRDCIARFPSGVHVVTTDGPAGLGGFTATAVASVSDDPPTVLVCLNRRSPQTAIFLENRCFALNLMAAGTSAIADAFAGRTGLAADARLSAAAWTRLATGSPALEAAVTTIDCRILEVREVGTHNVIFGTVVGTRMKPHAPAGSREILVYHDRHYSDV